MEPACRKITRLILPAVRASIAETMNTKYNYTQEDIAEKLGVVQVAISKYLNKKYSKSVADLKTFIVERGLDTGIVKSILNGNDAEHIHTEIERLCTSIVETI